MDKLIVTWALVAVVAGCGPEADDGDGERPPGTLEYEIPSARFYRDDRRVDVVGVDPMVDRSGCGFLTNRAYEDLIDTFDGLDPARDYSRSDCTYEPVGLVYLEGFAHGPFACSWYCCHPDLLPLAIVYFAVGETIDGPDPNIEGEIYVALEPSLPCPE